MKRFEEFINEKNKELNKAIFTENYEDAIKAKSYFRGKGFGCKLNKQFSGVIITSGEYNELEDAIKNSPIKILKENPKLSNK